MSSTYRTKPNQAWDQIAVAIWGADCEPLMRELITANPEHRETVLFDEGELLNIPDVDVESLTQETGALPVWKSATQA